MNKVYTTREAADLLGVSLRTIQLWVESGVLQAWKTAGGHRRIAQESVDHLLQQQNIDLRSATGGEEFNILVVEDEPDILILYKHAIAAWQLPVKVITASNGFEALIKMGQVTPHVLITDVRMPNMDGMQMIRMLRTDPDFDDMAIIVVTALEKLPLPDDAEFAKGISFFNKPIPFESIETIVRNKFESLTKQRQKE